MSHGEALLFVSMIVGLLSFLVGLATGQKLEEMDTRDAALKRGDGEYYLDEHNTRRWRWKGGGGR